MSLRPGSARPASLDELDARSVSRWAATDEVIEAAGAVSPDAGASDLGRLQGLVVESALDAALIDPRREAASTLIDALTEFETASNVQLVTRDREGQPVRRIVDSKATDDDRSADVEGALVDLYFEDAVYSLLAPSVESITETYRSLQA